MSTKEEYEQLEALGKKISDLLRTGLTEEEFKQVMDDASDHGDICPVDFCLYCMVVCQTPREFKPWGRA